MRKIALLVGVEQYRDPRITPLLFASADVLALEGRLRDRCAFDEVRVLTEKAGYETPDLHNVLRALDETAAELSEEDLFVFYFSGHGIEQDGRAYLLTADSSETRPHLMSLSRDVLEDTLHNVRARHRALLFDACRNAPHAGKGAKDNLMGATLSRDIMATAQSAPDSEVTTALLSACKEGARAFEWPKWGHGIFTHFLIEGLDGAAWEGDALDFRKLARHTIREVQQFTTRTPGFPSPQAPWYQEFGAADSILLGGGTPTPDKQHAPASVAGRILILEPPCLHITTQPSGAAVSVEGCGQGGSPVRVELPGGTHTVRVEKDGFRTWERRIEFDGQGHAELPVTLEALPKGPQAGEVKTFSGIEMVWIPPGGFMMGSPEDEEERWSCEGPQHRVTISRGFWLGKYPVTQAQWEAVTGNNPSTFTGEGRLPVERVSWGDCQTFIQKLKQKGVGAFRLPTEAEWEYACRAGTTTAYYLGNKASQLGDYAWFAGNGGGNSHIVGQKRPNACGLHDMHGNVWEWCEDDWHDNYTGAPSDGRAWVDSPRGSSRVLRGGSWSYSPGNCRSATRLRYSPKLRYYILGFRLALPAVR